MSLTSALQIGRSALVASQAGIQVAGNNMANAATVGFHRQTMHLAPARGDTIGRNIQVGRGVQVNAVRREIDSALQARYRDALSRQHRDLIDQRFLTALESLQGELTDHDLSSLLSTFFNGFSELANNPQDNAVRSVVIQQGATLAERLASMRSDYGVVMQEVDRSLDAATLKANDILTQIAYVNGQISQTEGGGAVAAVGGANSLRDQRDILIDELSQYLEITTVEQPNGGVDILVGSTPILLGGLSRGIQLRNETINGQNEVSVRVAADGTRLTIDSGQIGGLLRQREQAIKPAIDALDEFTGQLIFQVNRLHSQGQGKHGYAAIAGDYRAADPAAVMNSAAADLPFDIVNGSFFIHVTHAASGGGGGAGIRTTHQINVDGSTMSLNDLISQINTVAAVPNVIASLGPANQLQLNASPGYEISFSDDTAGALAALGLNCFFTGVDASDIDVSAAVKGDPDLLAATSDHVPGSNGTALSIADLQNAPVAALGGRSLREHWQNQVNSLAVKLDAANAAAESSAVVKDGLNAQIQAVSGVSLDEEAINLLTFQRQFQAAAKFISVIDETLQTLLSIA